MPTSQMFPTDRVPYRLTLEFQEDAYEGFDSHTITCRVEMTSGMTATLGRWQVPYGDRGNIPSDVQDVLDAWLYGEGLKALLVQIQRWDRSAQGKRVRRGLMGL